MALEEGCQVEDLQPGRIERALMLFLITAWRIIQSMRLGQTLPDLDAVLLLDPDEIKAADFMYTKPVQKSPLRLNEVVRLMAGLGGLISRAQM